MYARLNYMRFFLAWSVLAFHMNITVIPMAGLVAVWCFFFISGFLISKILYGRYSGRPGDFLINRFLRIFPAYWTALLLGFIIIAIDPTGIKKISPYIFMPTQYERWVETLFLFNMLAPPHVIPVARSLSIELNWYLIIFVCSFLPKKWVISFLLAGLLVPFIVYFGFNKAVYDPGAGFSFCLGALAYHLRINPPKGIQIGAMIALPVLMFIVPVCFSISFSNLNTVPASLLLMGSVSLMFLALPLLMEGNRSSRLSMLAGDLSYPMFLIHMFAAYLAMRWFDLPRLGWTMLVVVTGISLVLSGLMTFLVEKPIARIRKRVRLRTINR